MNDIATWFIEPYPALVLRIDHAISFELRSTPRADGAQLLATVTWLPSRAS